MVKVLEFILVYILSVVDFLIMLAPLTLTILFCSLKGHQTLFVYTKFFLVSSVVFSSTVLLVLLVCDYIFDRSSKSFQKGCTKLTNVYPELAVILEQVRSSFNKKNVKFLLKNSPQVNAYAIGGLRKNCVIITSSLISLYKNASKNDKRAFFMHIKVILSHEMSHIINKDFFPGLVLVNTQKANYFIGNIINRIYYILVRIISFIPFLGYVVARLILLFQNIFNKVLMFVYSKVILKVNSFIKLQISKSIEYRADRQSAQVCGGKNTATTLSLLGNSGYFTLFSSHPSTRNRIKAVSKITIVKYKIYPQFINSVLTLVYPLVIVLVIHIAVNLIDTSIIKSDYYSLIAKIQNIFFALTRMRQSIFGK